jgi:hypothetical protein
MSHIFISYSRKNIEYAKKLQKALERKKYLVWRDENEILPGDNWLQSIFDGVKKCSLLVVIMTPDSLDSKYVEREILVAETLKKPTIPLLLEGDCFLFFINTQYDNVSGGKLPSEKFYKKLDYEFQKINQSTENISPEVEEQKSKQEYADLEDKTRKFGDLRYSDSSEIYQRMDFIREYLIQIAKERTAISYKELGLQAGLANPEDWWRVIPSILGQISVNENREGRPLLSVLVGSGDKNKSTEPGKGFYSLARTLKPETYLGVSNETIWIQEGNKVYEYWATHED